MPVGVLNVSVELNCIAYRWLVACGGGKGGGGRA